LGVFCGISRVTGRYHFSWCWRFVFLILAGILARSRRVGARARHGLFCGVAMESILAPLVLLTQLMFSVAGPEHIVLKGRLAAERYPGSGQSVPMTAVYCFASLAGSDSQAVGFRTFEMAPSGWYFLPGSAGRYSIVFSDPSGFMRPIVLTNQFTKSGDVLDRVLSPVFDYADFYEGAWDTKPASDYYQSFVAKGTSVTSVGFKLATDGVDGPGPGGQNVLVSIHKSGPGTPEDWEQVGPVAVVLNVDCGGAKNYWWSAGWDSGQVPTEPGRSYAVHLRPESQDNALQAFWRADEDGESDCFRVGQSGPTGWQKHKLCMAVASDSDGLLIPYNKSVHKKFVEFAGFDKSWSQTYIARGRGLASVILYAATSGVQPSLMRQRVRVRVRQGGPDGPTVGIEKIAIGNGNYTGDASWGVFGVSFAPGEVPLEPGRLYAVEFESIENYRTLHGYVNIKGQVSDDKPGFNPYRKVGPDTYEQGTAYRRCRDSQEFDLDMQVIEYQHAAENWQGAVEGDNLLKNGDMELAGSQGSGKDSALFFWKRFSIDSGTTSRLVLEGEKQDNQFARVLGGSETGRTADGGFVQKVAGLSGLETYRLSGRVRSTWPVDDKHWCMVGFDPTGQESNPRADSIRWTVLPSLQGVFVSYESPPIRPTNGAVSVWLRGRTTLTQDYRFEADFDDFALHRVTTGVPKGAGR
jgi:hypothetical protein